MLVPSMLEIPDVIAQSGYKEEQVYDLGISGEIVILVVVPELGACKVPEVALSHFMAGADEYLANGMQEHYSKALSGNWNIKRDRLRILSESWEDFSAKAHKLAELLDSSQSTYNEFTTVAADGMPVFDRAAHDRYLAEKKDRNSKNLYTMREAAETLAQAHAIDARAFIKERMIPAFRDGLLMVIDPKDGGPLTSRACNDFTDLVTPDGLDAWLDGIGFLPYMRWPEQPKTEAMTDVAALPTPKSEQASTKSTGWKSRIQIRAAELMTTLRGSGANPTVHSILDEMVRWCRVNEVKTDSGIFPSAGYLRTHVLGGKHWTPPK